MSKEGKYPLPFKLETIELNKIKKYYVPQRQFSDKEIVKILTSLEKNKLLSDDETKRLSAKLLTVSASKEKARDLYKKVKKTNKVSKKTSQTISQTYIDFIEACSSNDRIVFRIKDMSHITISGFFMPKSEGVDFTNKDGYGYAYTTIELENQTYAVIYLEDIKQVLVTRIQNLELLRSYSKAKNINASSFILNDDKCSNIDEWLEKYYSGKYGDTDHYKLKIVLDPYFFNFDEFVDEYKKFWKIDDFKYELIEEKIPSSFGNGDIVVERIVIFELDANFSSFYKWYNEKSNFDNVIILEPAHYNDLFLASRIDRYARRLSEYGSQYNYEIVRDPKFKYQEYLKEKKVVFPTVISEKEIIKNGGISIYLGDDNAGVSNYADLRTVKNIIGVGTTGAGKSVYLQNITKKWMRHFSPEQLKFCFVDDKRIEFIEYENSPYLYEPIIYDADSAILLIDKLSKLSKERIKSNKIDFHVVVLIDEFSSISWRGKEVQSKIASIMKETEKNGIHFILMSQLKAYSDDILNAATTKINFLVLDKEDAFSEINSDAAINLLGYGDELVYNKELFGDNAKPMKIMWDNND